MAKTFAELDGWSPAVVAEPRTVAGVNPIGDLEVWPAERDLGRLRGYAVCNRLYAGKHQEVFDSLRKVDQPPYVALNFLKRLSVQTAFRMMGETALVRVSRKRAEVEGLNEAEVGAFEEVLGEIQEESNWPLMLFMGALAASVYGDAVLKVIYRSASDTVRIVNQRPWYYFPRFDVEDGQEPVEVTLAWRRPSAEMDMLWLREEVHTPGLIRNRLWRLEANEGVEPDQFQRTPVALSSLPEFAQLPEELETRLTVIPLIHIPNDMTVFAQPWGVSDYASVDIVQDALNARRTNTRTVLDKHAEPLLAIDESFLDEQGQLNMENIRALPLVQDEPPPQYITWNGSLSDSREEARDLELAFWRAAGFSPESLGLGDAAGVESGRAMRLRENLTTATMMGKQLVWGPALRRVVWIALSMWTAWVQDKAKPHLPFVIGPRDLEVEFGDGLPRDEVEEVQTASQIKASRLPETDATLLRRMHPDWTDRQIAMEVAAFERQEAAALERRTAESPLASPQLAERGGLRERVAGARESRASAARADLNQLAEPEEGD